MIVIKSIFSKTAEKKIEEMKLTMKQNFPNEWKKWNFIVDLAFYSFVVILISSLIFLFIVNWPLGLKTVIVAMLISFVFLLAWIFFIEWVLYKFQQIIKNGAESPQLSF